MNDDKITEVHNGIYISSLSAALDATQLRTNNINVIINLSGITYESDLPVYDIFMSDVLINDNTLDDYLVKFTEGIQIIWVAKENDHNVLVHCAAGINRSATLIALYLISKKMPRIMTIDKLKRANKKRNVPLLTNSSFRWLIKVYSDHVVIKRSTDQLIN